MVSQLRTTRDSGTADDIDLVRPALLLYCMYMFIILSIFVCLN